MMTKTPLPPSGAFSTWTVDSVPVAPRSRGLEQQPPSIEHHVPVEACSSGMMHSMNRMMHSMDHSAETSGFSDQSRGWSHSHSAQGALPGRLDPPKALHVGDMVQYYSETYKTWLGCSVIDTRPNGELQISCKRGHWISLEEQASMLRKVAPSASPSTSQAPPQISAAAPVDGSLLATMQFFSETLGQWVDCNILETGPTGEVRISCKPGYWISVDEQARKLRPKQGVGSSTAATHGTTGTNPQMVSGESPTRVLARPGEAVGSGLCGYGFLAQSSPALTTSVLQAHDADHGCLVSPIARGSSAASIAPSMVSSMSRSIGTSGYGIPASNPQGGDRVGFGSAVEVLAFKQNWPSTMQQHLGRVSKHAIGQRIHVSGSSLPSVCSSASSCGGSTIMGPPAPNQPVMSRLGTIQEFPGTSAKHAPAGRSGSLLRDAGMPPPQNSFSVLDSAPATQVLSASNLPTQTVGGAFCESCGAGKMHGSLSCPECGSKYQTGHEAMPLGSSAVWQHGSRDHIGISPAFVGYDTLNVLPVVKAHVLAIHEI